MKKPSHATLFLILATCALWAHVASGQSLRSLTIDHCTSRQMAAEGLDAEAVEFIRPDPVDSLRLIHDLVRGEEMKDISELQTMISSIVTTTNTTTSEFWHAERTIALMAEIRLHRFSTFKHRFDSIFHGNDELEDADVEAIRTKALSILGRLENQPRELWIVVSIDSVVGIVGRNQSGLTFTFWPKRTISWIDYIGSLTPATGDDNRQRAHASVEPDVRDHGWSDAGDSLRVWKHLMAGSQVQIFELGDGFRYEIEAILDTVNRVDWDSLPRSCSGYEEISMSTMWSLVEADSTGNILEFTNVFAAHFNLDPEDLNVEDIRPLQRIIHRIADRRRQWPVRYYAAAVPSPAGARIIAIVGITGTGSRDDMVWNESEARWLLETPERNDREERERLRTAGRLGCAPCFHIRPPIGLAHAIEHGLCSVRRVTTIER
jgi:hypothetical protein